MFQNQAAIEAAVGPFDSFRLGEVRQLTMTFDRDGDQPRLDLWIQAEYLTKGGEFEITLTLTEVRQLRLGDLGPQGLTFDETEFQNRTEDGLEGIRYEMISQGDGPSGYFHDLIFEEAK